MSDEIAAKTFHLMFTSARRVPDLFRLIRAAMEQAQKRNFENLTGEISLNDLQKYSKCNFGEFSFSEKNAADLALFKEAMKNYGVKYSIVKSKEYSDGKADYHIIFEAKNQDLINAANKDFMKKFDEMDAKSFDKRFEKAEKSAEKKNKERQQEKTQTHSKGKAQNYNKDINPR